MVPSAVESHPQKKKIIQYILEGKPVRDIARLVSPPLDFNVIQRYRTKVVRPSLANAEAESRILLGSKALSADTLAIRATQEAIQHAPALHIRQNRINLTQDMTDRLVRVVQERAADMSVCEHCREPQSAHPYIRADGFRCDVYQHVPGGQTGLIVRKIKQTGTEYAVDTGLLSEIREHAKQVAIELGQWQEGATPGHVSIQIVCPASADPAALPRISYSSDDSIDSLLDRVDTSELGLLQKPG